jgi:hypothetical protein
MVSRHMLQAGDTLLNSRSHFDAAKRGHSNPPPSGPLGQQANTAALCGRLSRGGNVVVTGGLHHFPRYLSFPCEDVRLSNLSIWRSASAAASPTFHEAGVSSRWQSQFIHGRGQGYFASSVILLFTGISRGYHPVPSRQSPAVANTSAFSSVLLPPIPGSLTRRPPRSRWHRVHWRARTSSGLEQTWGWLSHAILA